MEKYRKVGVGVDYSPCSRQALRWTVDNLIRDGDILVLVTVLSQANYESGEMQLWELTGSPLIPQVEFSDPGTRKKYGLKDDPETLDVVNSAMKKNKFSVLMKIYWGDPRERLCESVDSVPLSCLVIGNRGLGILKRAIMGSVSHYVVSNSSCPVTVVKEELAQPVVANK